MDTGQAQIDALVRLIAIQPWAFENLLDATPAVIYVKSLDGHYQFINRRFEELFHVTRQEALSKTDHEIFRDNPDIADAFRANDAWVAHTGEPLQIEEIAPHEDGPRNYLSVKFPLLDRDGEVRSIAGISTDITELVRANRRVVDLETRAESLLRAVGDAIVGLDSAGRVQFANPATAQMLGRTVEEMCGADFVELVQPREFSLSSTGAFAGRSFEPGECPLRQALATGEACLQREAWFVTSGTADQVRDQSPGIPVEFSCIPKFERRRLESAVVWFRDITPRLQRQQMQCDLQAAREVQQHFYPPSPVLPGYDIAGQARPAEAVCGDYYDFIRRRNGDLVVAIGDASGHDLAASLLMVNTRAYLRGLLNNTSTVSQALTELMDALAEDVHLGKFVSLFLANLDLDRRLLTYAAAGHEAWLLRDDGKAYSLRGEGVPLGIPDARCAVEMESIGLETGDILLFSTDGLTEASRRSRGELYGSRRLVSLVRSLRDRPAREIVAEVFADTRAFAGGLDPRDDQTIVIVKVEEKGLETRG